MLAAVGLASAVVFRPGAIASKRLPGNMLMKALLYVGRKRRSRMNFLGMKGLDIVSAEVSSDSGYEERYNSCVNGSSKVERG